MMAWACGSDAEGDEAGPDKSDSDTAVADTTDTTAMMQDTAVLIDTTEIEMTATDEIEELTVETAEVPKELEIIDLSKHGYPIKMTLPSGTEISTNDFDDLILQNGEGFFIEVKERDPDFYPDVATQKSMLAKNSNMHNELLGFVYDEPHGFIVKKKTNGIVRHDIYYVIKTPEMEILMENEKGRAYSAREAKRMWEAAETSEAIE